MRYDFVSLTLVTTVVSLILYSIQLQSHGNEVFACSCVQPKPPNEALNESKSVFSGKVTDIKSNNFGKIITFDIDRAWKGISNSTVDAATASDTAACGYPFEQGKEYLVYSYSTEDSLEASLCSRTKPLAAAQEDLVVLGAGYVPTRNTEIAGPPPDSSSFPFFVGLGAAVAGVIAYFTLRKQKR